MSLSIGIVGLPNVGKSTLFKTITKKQVDIQNYPFCTIDPNVGVVTVPDKRVEELVKLTNSEKKVYATVEFVDIAGLIKGASEGEGLGNQFLANIRECDAIVYVLRAFQNDKIINTQDEIHPIKDKEILDMELIIKDEATIDKRISSIEKGVRANKKEDIEENNVLQKIKGLLKEGRVLSEVEFEEKEMEYINQYQLLTMKPRLYLLNGKDEEVPSHIIEKLEENNWKYLIVDIETEYQAYDLTPDEREEFGYPRETELDILIKESYKLLNLITFLTTGSDETRAWTLEKDKTAPEAGGVIHNDLESHFIKAEVINWKDLVDSGGFPQAREKGLIGTKGKEYIVQDGDVIEIKHNA